MAAGSLAVPCGKTEKGGEQSAPSGRPYAHRRKVGEKEGEGQGPSPQKLLNLFQKSTKGSLVSAAVDLDHAVNAHFLQAILDHIESLFPAIYALMNGEWPY